MSSSHRLLLAATAALLSFTVASCSAKKNVSYTKDRVPGGASIAVIIDSPNNVKNVVMAEFMKRKFRVKAINASDIYEMGDIFNLEDFKKVSYNSNSPQSLVSMERAYNNVYKLHLYNYEINKAEFLEEIKNKFGVQYLVLLDLANWEDVSWARVIDLKSYEIIWLENYPTSYNDTVETVIEHFIKGMTGR